MNAQLIPNLKTAADLVRGVQDHLELLVPALLEIVNPRRAAAGRVQLEPVGTWQVVPDLDAIAAAALPAIAIQAPSVRAVPVRSGAGKLDATWDLSVGIFDRGVDHLDTQDRVETWAAIIRAAGLLAGSLGGLISKLSWQGEAYALLPDRAQARTMAGAEVMFEITAPDAIDLEGLRQLVAPDPIVTATESAIEPTAH